MLEFEKGRPLDAASPTQAAILVDAALKKGADTPDSILEYVGRMGYSLAQDQLEAAMAVCAAPLSSRLLKI
jgi:hypothetical protein